MGPILPGKATTAQVVRTTIHASEASAKVLAKTYGINPKTVLKWKNRDGVEDQKCGSKPGQNSVLSALDEAIVVDKQLMGFLADVIGPLQLAQPSE